MDKKQFATLAIGIKSAYPASKILEENASMDFWYTMLQDIPYEIADNAILEHICTNVYPPNIAEIRKLCVERSQPPVLSFDEAWGIVQSALTTYGRENPNKAFSIMDDLTLSVVKNLGWNRLCQSENMAADRANFREAYEAKAKQIQNRNQLPEFVVRDKALLQKMYMPAIESSAVPLIEQEKTVQDTAEELTEEQIIKRHKMYEELERSLLGGKSEAE